MTDVASEVCVTVGKDYIRNNGGARHDDAIDVISQEVAKFMNSKRTEQTTDAYFVESYVLREKAEARM